MAIIQVPILNFVKSLGVKPAIQGAAFPSELRTGGPLPFLADNGVAECLGLGTACLDVQVICFAKQKVSSVRIAPEGNSSQKILSCCYFTEGGFYDFTLIEILADIR